MASVSIPASMALAVHLFCVLGLAVGYWLAQHFYTSTLVADPVRVLRLLLAVESPVLIIAYSLVRSDRGRTSFLKAIGRGLLGLPIGALMNAFGAIVLGAPIWLEYLTRTVSWSLLMSLFTFVPAVCVFGSSWNDWQRILAISKITGALDYMVSLPGHGAVIGAWFGAWPMPLDWERPWQLQDTVDETEIPSSYWVTVHHAQASRCLLHPCEGYHIGLESAHDGNEQWKGTGPFEQKNAYDPGSPADLILEVVTQAPRLTHEQQQEKGVAFQKVVNLVHKAHAVDDHGMISYDQYDLVAQKVTASAGARIDPID